MRVRGGKGARQVTSCSCFPRPHQPSAGTLLPHAPRRPAIVSYAPFPGPWSFCSVVLDAVFGFSPSPSTSLSSYPRCHAPFLSYIVRCLPPSPDCFSRSRPCVYFQEQTTVWFRGNLVRARWSDSRIEAEGMRLKCWGRHWVGMKRSGEMAEGGG